MASDEFPTNGLEPDTGGASFASFTPPDSGGLLAALSSMDPKILGALLGAAGPAAGLFGNLISGGQTGTQTGNSSLSNSGSQSGSQTSNTSGTQSNQQTGQTSANGYNNSTQQQTLDPAAQSAMDRLTAMFNNNSGGAQGAYDQGLSLLRQLATGTMGSMTGGSGASMIPGQPNTTATAAPATGFPTELPTTYNPAIGNLIKQAMGSFVGDLGSQAITNARNRGFAGGGELLGSAAAPMMGQSLAQVPAMEAKAYMDHVLQAYDEQSQNASREAGANAGALNAATNALGPGIQKYGMDVSKYGIDRNADNQQLNNMTSLMQALMGPQNALMQGNLNLLNTAPRGSTNNTLTGNTSNSSLSGTQQNNSQTNSQSNSLSQNNSQGNTSQTGTTPLGNVIGTGLGNIIGGAATGVAANSSPNDGGFQGITPNMNGGLSLAQRQSLLALLGQK